MFIWFVAGTRNNPTSEKTRPPVTETIQVVTKQEVEKETGNDNTVSDETESHQQQQTNPDTTEKMEEATIFQNDSVGISTTEETTVDQQHQPNDDSNITNTTSVKEAQNSDQVEEDHGSNHNEDEPTQKQDKEDSQTQSQEIQQEKDKIEQQLRKQRQEDQQNPDANVAPEETDDSHKTVGSHKTKVRERKRDSFLWMDILSFITEKKES